MKKNGVTKRTWDKNVKTFAARGMDLWDGLNKFVDLHCKSRSSAAKEKFLDELTELIDGYVNYNSEILTWCRKNDVNAVDFCVDVMNKLG